VQAGRGRHFFHLIQIGRVMHTFELFAGDPGRIDALPGAQQAGSRNAIEHCGQPRRCFRMALAGLMAETIGVGQQYAVHAAGGGATRVKATTGTMTETDRMIAASIVFMTYDTLFIRSAGFQRVCKRLD